MNKSGTLYCNECQKWKPISDYTIASTTTRGYQYKCKPCKRKLNIEREFGIGYKEIAKLILEQDNKCDICKREFIEKRPYHIDHDHMTDKLRGLICFNCNVALGNFKDSIEVVQAAVEYLKKHSVGKSQTGDPHKLTVLRRS